MHPSHAMAAEDTLPHHERVEGRKGGGKAGRVQRDSSVASKCRCLMCIHSWRAGAGGDSMSTIACTYTEKTGQGLQASSTSGLDKGCKQEAPQDLEEETREPAP